MKNKVKTTSFIEDRDGNKSSKRLCGFVLCSVSVLLALALAVFSFIAVAPDASSIIAVINAFLAGGCGLLGLGVAEKITKK